MLRNQVVILQLDQNFFYTKWMAALEKGDVFKQTTGLNQWWSCYHKRKGNFELERVNFEQLSLY